jgi:hypothetical protein
MIGDRRHILFRAFAGIECGVLGGVAMALCWAASSTFEGQPPWVSFNLLGSLLDAAGVLRRGLGPVTLVGVALHVVVAGAIGLAFGLVMGEARNRLRTALLAILTGLLWYYVAGGLWRRLGALAYLYIPLRTLLFSHLLYGLALACYGRALDRIWRSRYAAAPSAPSDSTPPAQPASPSESTPPPNPPLRPIG